MPQQTHLELIYQSLLQEHELQLSQVLLSGLLQFSRLIENYTKEELWQLKFYLLEQWQEQYTDQDFEQLCRMFLSLIEKQLKKVDH